MLGLKLPTDPRWANIAEKNIDDMKPDEHYKFTKNAGNYIENKCVCKIPYKFIKSKDKDKPRGWLCKSSEDASFFKTDCSSRTVSSSELIES